MSKSKLRRWSARRTAVMCSTMLTVYANASAQAQTMEVPVPPVRLAVDERGANLATGGYQLQTNAVAIGTNDTGMAFSLTKSGLVWTQPWRYGVYYVTNGVEVVVGTTTLNFNFVSGAYVNQQATGETLTGTANGTYTLTMRDGTIIYFDTSAGDPNAVAWHFYNKRAIAVANYILKPDGEKLTFRYKSQSYEGINGWTSSLRVRSVTSSNGYMTKIEYMGATFDNNWQKVAKVTLLNLGVDYCDPDADSCTGLTQTWPSMTFAESVAGAVTTRTETDTLSRVTTYTFNTTLRTTAIKRPSSATDNLVATSDATGKISSITANGVNWTYSWSLAAPNMTATITDPNGGQRVYVTDTTTKRVTSFRDELNRTTSYTYDSYGRLTGVTYPEGNQLAYTYDARGNVTQETAIAKPGSGLANIIKTVGYDASCTQPVKCDKPNWTRDAASNQTDYTYDSTHGGVLTVTAPAATSGGIRPQTRYTYGTRQAYFKNSTGSIVASGQNQYVLTDTSSCQTLASCAAGADEVKTSIGYGPQTAGTANNLFPVSVTKASGNNSISATTSFTYDGNGNRLTVDGPLSGTADTVRTRYDAARQVVGVVGPDPDGAGSRVPVAQRMTYNLDGQVTQSELGTVADQSDAAWASFSSQQQAVTTYDANGRPVKQEAKAGGTTYAVAQTNYDALGRVNCTVQRMDPAQWASQTDACVPQTSNVTTGPDRVSKAIYNAASEVTQVQAAVGTTDQANEASSTYNTNGTLAMLTDAENNRTTYEYDGFDRTAKVRFPNGTQGSLTSSTTDYEQFTYDVRSNITQRRLRDGQLINYTYDNLSRMTLKNLPGTEPDVSLSYDLFGRLTQASQTGNVLGFTYDALSRNLTQSGPLGSVSYQYDLAGRRTRTTWPDAFYVTYDYDVTDNVTTIRENGAASGIGVLGTYAYDNLGRRTTLTRGNGTVTTTAFDLVSRLSSLTHDLAGTSNDLTINGFTYNAASQIGSLTRSNDAYAWGGHYNVNRNYTVNGLNQMTAAGGTSLGYDGRGNLATSGTNAYTYSSENLLLTGPSSATLAYDPALRLYQTIGGGVTTRFQYDGSDLIGEYNASNALQRRYVHGPGDDEPLVWYEGSGTTDRRWLHADERSSVIAVSDGSGTMLGINRYDEFGIPQAGNLGRFGYTGQTWLAEIGMNYYKARMYSPTLGRFMQTDPIGYGDGMNLYNYVASDPVNGIDPSGLCGGGSGDNGTKPIEVCGGFLDASLFPSIGNGGRRQDANGPGGAERRGKGDKSQNNQSQCTGNKSIFASIAEGADTVGDVADGVAIGSAALGLITAPTGAGGAFFGGTALVAGVVGRVASGVSIVANLADGNFGGAGSGAVGLVGGHVAGRVVGSVATSAYARNRMFGNLSAGQQRRVDLFSDTGTSAGSRVASRAVCR